MVLLEVSLFAVVVLLEVSLLAVVVLLEMRLLADSVLVLMDHSKLLMLLCFELLLFWRSCWTMGKNGE